jgi:surface polysaccharide O-acyltransferase-like enzyme
MFLIVATHFFMIGFVLNGDFIVDHPVNAIIGQTFNIGGRLGNELFILISGFFLVNGKFKIERITRVLKDVWFWSYAILLIGIIYSLINKQQIFGIKTIIYSIFPIIFQQNWFVPPFLVMIALSPWINKGIKSLTKKSFRNLIFLLVIIITILPTIGLKVPFYPGYDDFSLFILLYLIAGYVKKYDVNLSKKVLFLGIGIGFSVQFVFMILATLIGVWKKSEFIYGNALYLNNQQSPFLLLMAFSIFVLVKNSKPFYEKSINWIASSTFGIYLISVNWFMEVIYKNYFSNFNGLNPIYFLLFGVTASIIIFVLSGLLYKVVSKIQVAIINKFPKLDIDFYISKIINKFKKEKND